jgi:hypothetical protein
MLAVCSRVGALGKILRENPVLRAAALSAVRSAPRNTMDLMGTG